MRPWHCTPQGLRLAISPNVGNSGAEFLVAGVRVRAAPDKTNQKEELGLSKPEEDLGLSRWEAFTLISLGLPGMPS